jgi:hypothetical protein
VIIRIYKANIHQNHKIKMKPKNIKQLVTLALSENKEHAELIIGKIPIKQSKFIESKIGVKLVGCNRIIDTSSIRHTINKHGSEIGEAKQGQVAVNIDDFNKIPMILKEPDTIGYLGLNNRKQHLFEYKKWIGANYFVVEAVRIARKNNSLIFTTMYKKKRKK